VCGGLLAQSAAGQTSAFTYQGRLVSNGLPVNGVYDFQFALYDGTNGMVAGPLTNAAAAVSNGLFAATIDFGAVVFNGDERWLEIGVRPSGNGAFTILNPRQRLTSAPYAITAGNITGGLPAGQLSGVVPAPNVGSFTNHSDVVLSGLAAGQVIVYSGQVWTNTAVIGPTPNNSILVNLSYAGTNVPVNAALGTHFRLVATNSFLLQNPTGASEAQRLVFEIIQDGVGGRTMAFGNAFKLGTDLSMVNLTTNANRRDFLTCISSGTNFYVVGFLKGF